jgi:hypothetical protein
VRWPSGLRRQLKVIPFVVHQYNRWSERAWVQIPLSSTLSFAFLLELGLKSLESDGVSTMFLFLLWVGCGRW